VSQTPALTVRIAPLPHGADLPLPALQSTGAAGFDLCAALADDAPLTLSPGARALIPTGLTMAIEPGFEGQVRPRSGLAVKHGLSVLNTPGTIDSDYRGEVKVCLINLGAEAFTVARGMRIAQIVFAPVAMARLERVDTLDMTARGAGGFGSTGV